MIEENITKLDSNQFGARRFSSAKNKEANKIQGLRRVTKSLADEVVVTVYLLSKKNT